MNENIKVWTVPEGYELDKDQSTETKVVLKKIEDKRVDSWKEYCDMMRGKGSYVVDMYGNVHPAIFSDAPVVGEFEDKEEARVFAAFSKLVKLRKNWIGNWKPDWKSHDPIFIIINNRGSIKSGGSCYVNSAMSFPTEELCEAFIDTFKDLLEIAKPLL